MPTLASKYPKLRFFCKKKKLTVKISTCSKMLRFYLDLQFEREIEVFKTSFAKLTSVNETLVSVMYLSIWRMRENKVNCMCAYASHLIPLQFLCFSLFNNIYLCWSKTVKIREPDLSNPQTHENCDYCFFSLQILPIFII